MTIQHHRYAPAAATVHGEWAGAASRRAAFLADYDSRQQALHACVKWLVIQGQRVENVDARLHAAGKPVVTVAASPYLHLLFGEDCACVERRMLYGHKGAEYIWAASSHDCEIRWVEVMP